ncbi:hypothetical protein SAMN04488503_3206 [Humidesulfovibrio mexicanus]|jgi:hypothetical protein|uniref:Uncharacterized protein n=1 Tax=Humidesulfovibrio mexicanus TaxID=147047 RepID=A0A239CN89_9BACT|nr:hypothetical protein [Humidesulfovibrio mexicanus]SNS21141.1 hypothetical protein SAMN04488503_3206 [Humidesulfovibrio mexicanus]
MFPKRHVIFSRAGVCAAIAALTLAAGATALAQNAVRGAAAVPPQSAAAGKDAAAKGDPAKAAPAHGQETPAGQTKFPNKDTAKNRRDYEMGTGSANIEIGRDEASGDTVMRSNPPKKQQEPSPLEMQPVQVWPVIPGHKGR